MKKDKPSSVKKLVLWSVVVTVVFFAAGLLWAWIDYNKSGGSAAFQRRSTVVGGACGTLIGVGYAIIWLPWASKVGKARREARSRKSAKRDAPRRKRS